MRSFERLKRLAVSKAHYNYSPFWIVDNGQLGIVFPKKYGKEWWARAKKSDVRRVTVH
jgi:hypothetical protein